MVSNAPVGNPLIQLTNAPLLILPYSDILPWRGAEAGQDSAQRDGLISVHRLQRSSAIRVKTNFAQHPL